MALDMIEAKYRYNLTFKNKAFDFIDHPELLRLKEVCDNFLTSV